MRRWVGRWAVVLALFALLAVDVTAGSARSAGAGGATVARAAAGPPNPKNLPGAKTVTFKLVVEGTSFPLGTRLADGGIGVCTVHLDDTIQERTNFARGKGVLMEFVRYRRHGHTQYVVQRVGRNGDASFVVVYKLVRRAIGGATWTPLFPGAPGCPQSEDVSKNPDCGKTFSGTTDWGLRLKGTAFSIAPTGAALLDGTGAPISDCGKSSSFGSLEYLLFQWSAPPALKFAPLPLAKLFGQASQFKVNLNSGVIKRTYTRTLGPLTVTFTDVGLVKAVVRFIREPNVP